MRFTLSLPLLPLLPLLLVSMAGVVNAAEPDAHLAAFDASCAVDQETLDAARGGFLTGDGLMVNLGLERLVSINGNVVERT